MNDIVKFNIRGIYLEIPRSLLKVYPQSTLYKYASQKPNDPPEFLDVNPYCFLTIIDYLKMEKLYIPRNVSTELVYRLLREFSIPFNQSNSALSNNEIDLPEQRGSSGNGSPGQFQRDLSSNSFDAAGMNNLPPPYEGPSEGFQGDLKSTPPVSKYTSTLDSQQKIMYRKLEPLAFQKLLPMISSHVDAGHNRLRIYILPPEVHRETIANDTTEEDLGYPREYFRSLAEDGCPDLTFLTLPKVLDLLKKTIMYATGIKDMKVVIKNITARFQNAFGLYESKSFDSVVVTMEIPPNCSF